MPRHSNKLVSIEEKVTIILKVHIIGIDLVKHIFHFVGHNLSGREDFRKNITIQKLRQLLSNKIFSLHSSRFKV